MKIYLAGSIDYEMQQGKRSEAKIWRDEFSKKLKEYGFEISDPMVREYQQENESLIPIADKTEILKCDVILVNYLRPSVGTSMEIMFGYINNKIIILINKTATPLSPWITVHCNQIV